MNATNGSPNIHHHVDVAKPTMTNAVHSIASPHSSDRCWTHPLSPLISQEVIKRTPAERVLATAPATNHPSLVEAMYLTATVPITMAERSTMKMNNVNRQGLGEVITAV